MSFLSNLIFEISKNKILEVMSSLIWLRKEVSNYFQDAIDPMVRLKNYVESLPKNVNGNNLQTSLCCTSINLRESINCFLWSSSVTSLSITNFGNSFTWCFGNGCCAPGTVMTSTPKKGMLVSMLARNFKFKWEDEGLVQGGLVWGGSRGPDPPTSTLGKS